MEFKTRNSNQEGKNFRSSMFESARRRRTATEQLAQNRTSQLMMRMLAGLAVRLAIRAPSRRPHEQDPALKRAEQQYMTKLWQKYTRQELQV